MKIFFVPSVAATAIFLILLSHPCMAQQRADLRYNPRITNPAYAKNEGPRVGIDEAHYNYHTATGRYKPFARLVERDGYQAVRLRKSLSSKSLTELDIVVIANPLHKRNARNWSLPTPSAFSDEEIEALHTWVSEGGSLLLIADHMPFPGAAGKLAKSFGFTFSNGYARPDSGRGGPATFKPRQGLRTSVVTRGRGEDEEVTKVTTFTGSAFKPPPRAIPILTFGSNTSSWEVTRAMRFTSNTPKVPIKGWCQGAIMKVGKGRVAVFGEAAMFTAQVAGRGQRRMGMNNREAKQNYQLLLNVMHWLSDLPGMRE